MIESREPRPTPDTSDMTFNERQALLFKMLDESVIGSFPIDAIVPGGVVMSFATRDPIQPGKVEGLQCTGYTTFKPRRLIILEPTITIRRQIIHNHTRGDSQLTPCPECARAESAQNGELVTVPRSAWTLKAMFIGCLNVFPNTPTISGDAFGLKNNVFEEHDCPTINAGIPTTIQLEHNLSFAMPFRALIVGTTIERQEFKTMASPIVSPPSCRHCQAIHARNHINETDDI